MGALAGATIGVPVAGALAPTPVGAVVGVVASDAPATAQILEASVSAQAETPTTVLAPVTGALRDADAVSRSLDRDPLPDCNGVVELTSGNGQIPAKDLCTLWDGTNMLRGDAAVALTELNQNFKAALGHDLCITDSYRTLAVQRRLAYTKPGLAATPGTSNHGWGLAIDLCGTETHNSTVMAWLSENGPTFGWDNPAWARPGGSGAYEPWHWEYVPGTTKMGTNWD
ncbi:M15 family metallopeptidase [Actinotalea sp. M2MS4P-6]|uniref:M15 family metallopeptidase n=1 Tax=Actinotalea sp. M2MS4P-6 TaxID=2983762 RepID=UPI0021E3B4A5|nr:M15 family metallopeptidase [Actinotalea sp. M2MS4P-6]MCV2394113.1 M15 family metallopeptidase [Actinotalea sp. M2MS4P-6]